jgi:hypothetical protein
MRSDNAIPPAMSQSYRAMSELAEILAHLDCEARRQLGRLDTPPAIVRDLVAKVLMATDIAQWLLEREIEREIEWTDEFRTGFADLGIDFDEFVDAKARNDIPRALALIREARERRR